LKNKVYRKAVSTRLSLFVKHGSAYFYAIVLSLQCWLGVHCLSLFQVCIRGGGARRGKGSSYHPICL